MADYFFEAIDRATASSYDTSKRIKDATRVAGGYLLTAMLDVARDLDGEGLVEQVRGRACAVPDSLLPDPSAFRFLEDTEPGSGKRVLTRMREIQKEAYAAERAESRYQPSQLTLRVIVRGIIDGLGSEVIINR